VSRTHITYILPGVDAELISGFTTDLEALRSGTTGAAYAAIHDHVRIVGSMFDSLFVSGRLPSLPRR